MSAMVRLNTLGLQEKIDMNELKKLPNIPGTGMRIRKKKNLTDWGIVGKCNLSDALEEEELMGHDSDNDQLGHSQVLQPEEDTTTVFDLVHRGRQRQQHFKHLQK